MKTYVSSKKHLASVNRVWQMYVREREVARLATVRANNAEAALNAATTAHAVDLDTEVGHVQRLTAQNQQKDERIADLTRRLRELNALPGQDVEA